MSIVPRQHKETLLIEILLCSLDVRSTATAAEAPMLAYLADLLVKCAREELDGFDSRIEVELDTAKDGGFA